MPYRPGMDTSSVIRWQKIRDKHPNNKLGLRGWQTGMSNVPAIYRALLATPDWYVNPWLPDPPLHWSNILHSDFVRLIRGATKRRLRTATMKQLRDFMDNSEHKLHIRWELARDGQYRFRATDKFVGDMHDANTLHLWPVEVANMQIPPRFEDDTDVLAVQAFCSGMRDEWATEFLIDAPREACCRGLAKLCDDVGVQVSIAMPFVRYLNGVRMLDGASMRDNLAAVQSSLRSPLRMKEPQRKAWAESSVLGPALAEALALRKNIRLTRHMEGFSPKAWPPYWRYNNHTMIMGRRWGDVEEV